MILWILLGFAVLVILVVGYYGGLLITDIPSLAVPYTPKDFGWAFERVSFRTSDGLLLQGWFIPAEPPTPVTILIQHGVGSNHGDTLPNVACLRAKGRWNLLLYNFRGHADSEGRDTSLGPLELLDMEAALKFLKENKPNESRRLGLYGHSLGAAVALVGAARHPEIEAVAVESPFASLTKTVRHFATIMHGIPYFPFVPFAIFFASLRLRVKLTAFNPEKAISQLSPRPVLLIQGERDRRVPMSDFQALWAAAGEPKEQWVVPGADHGDPWLIAKEEYENRLVGFFRKVFS